MTRFFSLKGTKSTPILTKLNPLRASQKERSEKKHHVSRCEFKTGLYNLTEYTHELYPNMGIIFFFWLFAV